jgi:hypothetical protein
MGLDQDPSVMDKILDAKYYVLGKLQETSTGLTTRAFNVAAASQVWGTNAVASLTEGASSLGTKVSSTVGSLADTFQKAKDSAAGIIAGTPPEGLIPESIMPADPLFETGAGDSQSNLDEYTGGPGETISYTAASDLSTLVATQSSQNTKPLQKSEPWKVVDSADQYKDLFNIGRPCRFNSVIDPHHRFGNYLRSKMSVIDLIPVDYGVDLANVANMVAGNKEWNDGNTKQKTNTIYSLAYDKQIAKYGRICEYHGLKKFVGLRLFTTDDTTATDTIQVQYKDSTFQGMVDNLSGAGQSYKDVANLILGSEARSMGTTVTGIVEEKVQKANASLGGTDGIGKLLSGVAGVATDLILQGNKMTFPKIWQSSSYHGNLSVNIRLVSPYGHPKAIKEFIMKPLSYLVLLSAPQTINGVTYGGSIPITIKGYGLNYTVVGSIASMTFRRGGNDTSFNLYRQPLTIDVSIEFQTLYDAFAVFDPTESPGIRNIQTDSKIFNEPMLDSPGSLNLYTSTNKNNLMTSLGSILASLRPVRITGMDIDPQVYGLFEQPLRSDIPNIPAFIPLAGNLGSAITGAITSAGNFSNMITNAPKLIQQGLSNAVYNTAKGSVGSIVGSASGYLSSGSTAINNVVNKITGNLF